MFLQQLWLYSMSLCIRNDSSNSEEAEQNKAEKIKQLWDSFKEETK